MDGSQQPDTIIVTGAVGDVLEQRYMEIGAALAELCEALRMEIHTAGAPDALSLLDTEMPNIAHLLDTLLADPHDALEIVEDLYRSLGEYLSLRGLFSEKLAWGMGLMRRKGQQRAKVSSGLLNSIATAHADLGDHETAIALYRLVIDARAGLENDSLLAQAHTNLGISYWQLGQLDEAEAHLRQALAIDHARGDQRAAAMSLMNLANIAYTRWDMAASLELAQAALDNACAAGLTLLQAQFTAQIAVVMVANLRFDEAVPVYEEALRLQAQLSDEIGVARTQYNFALLCRLLRDYDRAQTLARASLTVMEQHRLPEAPQARDLLVKIAAERS